MPPSTLVSGNKKENAKATTITSTRHPFKKKGISFRCSNLLFKTTMGTGKPVKLLTTEHNRIAQRTEAKADDTQRDGRMGDNAVKVFAFDDVVIDQHRYIVQIRS
jgi:hypothetical protein